MKAICAVAAIGLSACQSTQLAQVVQEASEAEISAIDQANVPNAWIVSSEFQGASAVQWDAILDAELGQLIQTGLRNNLTVQAAELTLEAVRINLEQADARRRPRINLGNLSATGSLSDGGEDSQTFSLSASAAYEFDLWGLIENDIRRAEISETQQLEQLRSVRIIIAQLISRIYVDLRVQDELIQLQENQIRIQEDQLHLARTQLAAGIVTLLRIEQINVDIQGLRITLERLKSRRTVLQNSLSTLLGQPPRTLTLEPGIFQFLDVPTVQVDTPAITLANRPDILSAELSIVASGLSLMNARRAWLPELSVSASTGTTTPSLFDLLSLDGLAARLTASFATVLVDDGARGRAEARATIATEQSLNRYEAVVIGALEEIDGLLIQQDETLRQAELLALQKESQDRVTRITQVEFEIGVADAFDLIREQRNALSVRQQQVRNWATRMNIYISALGAFGIDP